MSTHLFHDTQSVRVKPVSNTGGIRIQVACETRGGVEYHEIELLPPKGKRLETGEQTVFARLIPQKAEAL